MNVETVLFQVLEAGAIPGFVLQLHVLGSGFDVRAVPLQARIGNLAVEQIFLGPNGTAFSGLLAAIPNNGDRLFVRFADEPEFSSDVIFGSFPNT